MADVLIKISRLETVAQYLGDIIDELESATSSSEALAAAIGTPFDRTRLRDQARGFAERWDDTRDELKESLEKVKDHLRGVVDGFETRDDETAIRLTWSRHPVAP